MHSLRRIPTNVSATYTPQHCFRPLQFDKIILVIIVAQHEDHGDLGFHVVFVCQVMIISRHHGKSAAHYPTGSSLECSATKIPFIHGQQQCRREPRPTSHNDNLNDCSSIRYGWPFCVFGTNQEAAQRSEASERRIILEVPDPFVSSVSAKV